MMDSLSVVILTRDRLAKLTRCLDALLPQLTGEDEALVVDTGSTDGTAEKFAANPEPRVRYLRFDGPGSWAEARNFAHRATQGSLIAFLDDDCYAAPDWVDRGRAALANADAVGGRVLPYGIERWPDWWSDEMGWLVGLSVPGHLTREAGRYFYPMTANLWVRRALLEAEPFQEIGGGFDRADTDRYETGREDAEWWRRVRVLGYRTVFDAKIEVEHEIDPARLDFDYMLRRARRDGEAWARREGVADDLLPLAYQWWLHKVTHEPAGQSASDPANVNGRHRRLMAARHRSALRALAAKLSVQAERRESPTLLRVRAELRAGARLLFDRSKNVARRVALAYAPPPKMSMPTDRPTRLTIAAFGFLGDLLILQSALRGLVKTYPDLQLKLLAPPPAETVFASMPSIALEPLAAEPGSLDEAKRRLREVFDNSKPELIIAPYLQGTWGMALARIRRLSVPVLTFDRDVGLKRRIDMERLAPGIHKSMSKPEVGNLMRLFAAAGLTAEPEPARLVPAEQSMAEVRSWIAAAASKGTLPRLLMLNPDAGQPNREWTDEAWARAIELLLAEFPHDLVVNLSRPHAELENRIAASPRLADRVRWFRPGPLDRFIACLALCEGLLTVDSGPQHLAHALDIPSLTLFGPTDERRWSDPFERPRHRCLRAGNLDLTPEELRGLPENHLMRLITPQALVESVRSWACHLSPSRGKT